MRRCWLWWSGVLVVSLWTAGSVGAQSPTSHAQDGPPAWLVALAKKRTFKPCAKKLPKNMVCIPGGMYVRGSQRNAQHGWWRMRAESPRHYVILDTFYIDKYEVTHARYRACVKAGYCKPSVLNCARRRWKRFCAADAAFVSATWWMARDYCKWAGKRLLSEAEWEAAARGPKGTTYPWGNSPPTCAKANYRIAPVNKGYPRPQRVMKFCPSPAQKGKPYVRKEDGVSFVRIGHDTMWKVGSTPPNPFGVYDMAGNGYEWVQDYYDPHAYAGCDGSDRKACDHINPRGPCDGKGNRCVVRRRTVWTWRRKRIRTWKTTKKGRRRRGTRRVWVRRKLRRKRPKRMVYKDRILKGGSWWWYPDRLRSAYRRGNRPTTGIHRLSIRCGSTSPNIQPLGTHHNRRRSQRRRR